MIIYVYSRQKLNNWVKEFIKNFKYSEVHVFSEYDFKYSNGYNFYPIFIHNLSSLAKDTILLPYNDTELNDIIQRCRLLRSMKKEDSINFIKSAFISIEQFIDTTKVDIFISPRIENYIFDLMERSLKRKNKRFIGLWRSAFLKNHFFFTNRGETISVREPGDDEVISFINKIGNISFKATSINGKVNIFTFLNKYFKYLFRDTALEILRQLWHYKYNFRELATRYHCIDYKVPLFNIVPNSISSITLNKILNNGKLKIFIALQVNPEATIDYYCKNINFINIPDTLDNIISKFSNAGFDVIIKDHPNMNGRRNFYHINNFTKKYKNVYIVPSKISSNYLLNHCNCVFTWSGTISIQSYFNSISTISIAPPFYQNLPNFYILNNYDELNLIIKNIQDNNIIINYDNKKTLAKYILSTHLKGNVFTHDNIKPDVNDFVDELSKYINNLNE
jgi:hypothetical protein